MPKEKTENFVSRNIRLKIMAVIMAVLCFYAIRGATSHEAVHDIPLEIQFPEGVALLDREPMIETVEVTFRGSRDDLFRLDPRQIKVAVKAGPGEPPYSEKVMITPADIHIRGASGAKAVKVRPSSILLTIGREVEKIIPVAKPQITGTPLAGRVEMDYEPKSVTIKGPEEHLKDHPVVRTKPIDVSRRGESFSILVPILVPGGDTWTSTINPSEVMARVNIVTETITREWENTPIFILSEQTTLGKWEANPPLVKVILHGSKELIEKIQDSQVKVLVDCSGLDISKTYKLPAQIHLPYGMNVTASVDPDTVKVTFKKKNGKDN